MAEIRKGSEETARASNPMKDETFKPVADSKSMELKGGAGSDNLTPESVDSAVKAPGMLQRMAEEVQAVGESIWESIVPPKNWNRLLSNPWQDGNSAHS